MNSIASLMLCALNRQCGLTERQFNRQPHRANWRTDRHGRRPRKFPVGLANLIVAVWLVLIPGVATYASTFTARWGTVTWPSGKAYYRTTLEACQRQLNDFSPGSILLGAEPFYGEWNSYQCEWTNTHNSLPTIVQLECVDENGVPDYAQAYKLAPPGSCIPTAEPNVARPICRYNKDANVNPSVGNPILLATGSLYETATDYSDADGRLTISRTYRSRAGSSGGVFPVYAMPYGAGDLWHFNFQWDLALDEQFFGGAGNFGITAPDGSNYGFTLRTDGVVVANNYGTTELSVQLIAPGGGSINLSDILNYGGQFLITTSSGDQISMGLYVPYWSTKFIVQGAVEATSSVTPLLPVQGLTMENSHAGECGCKAPIPAGRYDAFIRRDHRPNRIELRGVTGYKHIQIHNGSYPRDFIGCIGVGQSSGPDFLGGSRKTLQDILNLIRADGSGRITVNVNSVPLGPVLPTAPSAIDSLLP